MLTEAQMLRLYGRTPENGRWAGWRFTASGAQLVSPHGQRFTPERLAGLAWRQEMDARISAAKNRREQRVRQDVVTVVRINRRDWLLEAFGTVAG